MWLAALGTGAAAACVLLLPGLLAGVMLRLRGFTLLGAASIISLAAIGAASLIGIVVPIRWSGGVWVAVAGSIVVLAFVLGRIVDRTRSRQHPDAAVTPARTWLALIVLVGAATICAWRLCAAIGDPSHVSQTFDNVYHLNAVRWVLDTGQIAPTQQLIPGFYPSLWHALTATVALLSGATIPVAVNATAVVVAAVIWPISCLWLVRTVVGASALATLAGGMLSVGTFLFPMLLLDFGVLYPNVLAIALLPAALAALLHVAGIGWPRERPAPLARWALVFAAAPTLALAHPNVLMAFLLLGAPIVLTGFVRWFRASRAGAQPAARRWLGSAALFVLAVGAFVLFWVARPTREQGFWPPSASVPEILEQLGTLSLVSRGASWGVVLGAAVGAVFLLVRRELRRQWWLVAGWALLAFIVVVCAAFPQATFRYLVSGTWYQDLNRIVALLPVVLVPLGAIGVLAVATLAGAALRGRARTVTGGVVGLGACAALLVSTQVNGALNQESRSMARVYAASANAPLLSQDEQDLLEQLPQFVGEGEVIAGSPWTGTSLAYALADRSVLVPHIFTVVSADGALILNHLREAEARADVCAAVDATGVRWVLDFGAKGVHAGAHPYPGIEGLDAAGEGFRLAASVGEAKLYEVTACR